MIMGNTQKVNQKAKSWKEMTKKEKTNIVMVFVIIALIIFTIIISMIPSEVGNRTETTISGFEPAPTYLALKQMGFSKETNYGGEYGTSWTCTRIDYGISYVVSMYAPSASSDVQSYRLNITVEPGIEDIQKGLWMMKELACVEYDTSNPESARIWVENNYNNDGASTIIGDAKYTIFAPSAIVRTLCIEKNITE